jgi:hypothetical protein
MALFNLTDITFQAPGQARGPLKDLQNSKYTLNTYRYPEDIGSSDKGHYIAININEQNKTSYGGTQTGDNPFVIQNRIDNNIATFGGNLGKTLNGASDLINNVAGSLGAGSNFTGSISNAFSSLQSKIGNQSNAFDKQLGAGVNASIDTIKSFVTDASSVAFTRTIRRITDTVVLYMPDNLRFSYKQQYNTAKLGGTMGAAGLAAGASIADGVKSNDPNASANLGQNLSYMFMSLNRNLADGILGQGAGNAIFAAGAGMVQNPMMEMIYSNPEFRTFFINGKYMYTMVTNETDFYKPKQEGGSYKIENKKWKYLMKFAKRVMNILPKFDLPSGMQNSIITRIDIGSGLVGEPYTYFVNEVEFVPAFFIEKHNEPVIQSIGDSLVKLAEVYRSRKTPVKVQF